MELNLFFLGLLCLATLSCSQDEERFSRACNDFAINLLKNLSRSEGDNILYSPFSISILLAAIHQGAQGESSRQLQTVLGMNSETSRNNFASHIKFSNNDDPKTVTFKMGNKMYLTPSYQIDETFKSVTVENFDLGIENLDLGNPDAPQIINNWVSNATDNHITDLIQPGSLSSDSIMVLVSAVFFSGKWAKPFSDSIPNGKFFTAPNTSIQVPYFIESRRMSAGRQKDFKWVELPYEGETHSMVLILPLEMHKLDQVIQKLSGDSLMKLLNSPSTQYVRLRLPKFSLKKRINAKETLRKMGLTDIFSGQADLSGIGPSLIVSDMQHETFLEVTHEGTKAAAATSMVVNTLSLNWNPDEMKFIANQPFLAFIIDKRRQIPLFAARISKPK